MRNLFVVSAAIGLAACGISEEDYSAEHFAKYCETLATCGGGPCEPVSDTATDATDPMGSCNFDAAQAELCLDAEWTCNDLGFVEIPTECNNVYDCGDPTGGTTL